MIETEERADITEPQHRLHRAPESDAALVLRAVAWAALWWATTLAIGVALNQRYASAAALIPASLAVLQVVHSHRRRQR